MEKATSNEVHIALKTQESNNTPCITPRQPSWLAQRVSKKIHTYQWAPRQVVVSLAGDTVPELMMNCWLGVLLAADTVAAPLSPLVSSLPLAPLVRVKEV